MIREYAPVIIPTLNRYDHFKSCFESLEQCTGHNLTDVFVALDYPLSDKQKEGWALIDEYLTKKENSHPFKSLTVIRREKNYGVGCLNSNASELLKYVSSFYQRYIFTEDDNIFSPNFLEYINKGLERYENDSSVYGIAGYSHPYHFKFDDNNHYKHNTDMAAWGYGCWTRKKEDFITFVSSGGFRKSLSVKNFLKVKRHGWNRLYEYLSFCHHKGFLWMTDAVVTSYMIINDMYMISPSISKVRNIGWDGTGNSGDVVKKHGEFVARRHMCQVIDEASNFEYHGDDTSFLDYNNRIAAKESDGYMSFAQFLYKLLNDGIRFLFKRN